MEETEILVHAININGRDRQIDKAIEEFSELTKSLLKLRHAKNVGEIDTFKDEVYDELADVRIMVKQLMLIFDDSAKLERREMFKIDRLYDNLNKH